MTTEELAARINTMDDTDAMLRLVLEQLVARVEDNHTSNVAHGIDEYDRIASIVSVVTGARAKWSVDLHGDHGPFVMSDYREVAVETYEKYLALIPSRVRAAQT